MAKNDYAPPFAERLPDGGSVSYGPSPSTHARHLAEFRTWSWRPGRLASKVSRTREADRLRKYMRLPDGKFRADVPRRELQVYFYVFERGHSVDWVARELEIHKSTAKVYIQRLRKRSEG